MNITVKDSHLKKLLNHYPFATSRDVVSLPEYPAGSVVRVISEKGTFVGQGYYNATSHIPVRILTLKPETVNASFYLQKIQAAWQKRLIHFKPTDAFRVLHAEADGLPGVVADYFNGVLSVQIRNAGAEQHRAWIVAALQTVTGAKAAFERSDTAERNKEGLPQVSGVLWGDMGEKVIFSEGNVEFFFKPFQSQKTGYFLDQRDNRALMASRVQAGQNFLDVYSYTGAFSLLAAKKGASTLAIDKDAEALATLEAVARHNGLSEQVGMRWGDALEVLAQLKKEKRRFHHAVFDPPTLAKRKDDIPNTKRIFVEGLSAVLSMLEPEGTVLVSTCAHYFRVEDMLDSARLACGLAQREAEVITVTYQPPDHPWMLLIPESLYLKSILLKVL